MSKEPTIHTYPLFAVRENPSIGEPSIYVSPSPPAPAVEVVSVPSPIAPMPDLGRDIGLIYDLLQDVFSRIDSMEKTQSMLMAKIDELPIRVYEYQSAQTWWSRFKVWITTLFHRST